MRHKLTSSDILRRAARDIERDPSPGGGCFHIPNSIPGNAEWYDRLHGEAAKRAMAWFKWIGPRGGTCRGFWWKLGEPEYRDFPGHPRNKGARIIGLCLAAAIAESEGD